MVIRTAGYKHSPFKKDVSIDPGTSRRKHTVFASEGNRRCVIPVWAENREDKKSLLRFPPFSAVYCSFYDSGRLTPYIKGFLYFFI